MWTGSALMVYRPGATETVPAVSSDPTLPALELILMRAAAPFWKVEYVDLQRSSLLRLLAMLEVHLGEDHRSLSCEDNDS